MLINPSVLARYWKLNPTSIIHVGAHEAEELEWYESQGWGAAGIIWFEALPDKVRIIQNRVESRPLDKVFHGCLWSEPGILLDFGVANNGQSSSVLELEEHLKHYPEITYTHHISMESQIGDSFNCFGEEPIGLMNLDVQGAELEVLRGFSETLHRVEAIYSEINVQMLYHGAVQFPDLDNFLSERDFVLCDWVLTEQGWGDALWIRRSSVPTWRRLRRWARRLSN